MTEQTTKGVHIEATPQYQKEESKPEQNYFFWTYTITIRNVSEETVQLISRHWIITDGMNHIEEVQGQGVVGQQPMIKPGESFQYTSACPLSTPTGYMKGTYQMTTKDGHEFEAVIPTFSLVSDIVYH